VVLALVDRVVSLVSVALMPMLKHPPMAMLLAMLTMPMRLLCLMLQSARAQSR
jgi:hypothetical protein